MRTSTLTCTGTDTDAGTQARMVDEQAWGRLIAEPLTWWQLSGGGDDSVCGDVALCGLTVHNSLRAQSVEKPGKYRIHLPFSSANQQEPSIFRSKGRGRYKRIVISTEYATSQLSVCILRKSCGNITAT